MKLLDKLKDILFDEEVEEVEENVVPKKPVVTNVPPKEVGVIKEVEETTPVINDNLDNTFKFPLFDEKEFESTKPRVAPVREEPKMDEYRRELPKHEVTRSYYEEKTVTPVKNERKDYGSYIKEEPKEKHIFKPSPIISPVYGVLNKNYNKDDLENVSILNSVPVDNKPKVLNVDDVRKKAFGQLDEDLEKTLTKSLNEFYKTENKTVDEIIDDNMPGEEELDTQVIKETLSDINKNLENINDKMSTIEEKVDNKLDNEELDKPRSAVDLLNEIETELDELTEENVKRVSEIKDDFLDDFDDVKFDDIDEPVYEDESQIIDEVNNELEEVKVSTIDNSVEDDSDELFNLIDAMYDNNIEEESEE